MDENLSANTRTQHPLKHLFFPSTLTWLVYGLVSLASLVLLNIQALWQIFSGQEAAPFTSQDIAPLTDKFIDFQDKLATPAVMLLWMGIGVVTYVLIWFFENAAFMAKSELQQSTYVQKPKGYWLSALTSNLFLIFIVLIWISFIAVYLRVLLPVFTEMFNSGLYDEAIANRLIDTIGAVLANAFSIYLIVLFQRLLSYSWRLNRPD